MSRFRLLWRLLNSARLLGRLLREPKVPLLIKAIPVLAGLYIVTPVDFVPDLLPVLGQIDDLVILVVGVEAFFQLCPRETRAFHQHAIANRQPYSPMVVTVATDVHGDVIDAEWRRE